jgi:hypothetical protein
MDIVPLFTSRQIYWPILVIGELMTELGSEKENQ